MDATDALKDYAQEKIDRIKKYFPDPIKAHVVLSVDRSYDHTAEVTITLHNGIVIRGEETTENMYSSLDLVSAKIERQTRRYKEKIQKHKGQHSVHSLREVRHQGGVTAHGRVEVHVRPLSVAPPRQHLAMRRFSQGPGQLQTAPGQGQYTIGSC